MHAKGDRVLEQQAVEHEHGCRKHDLPSEHAVAVAVIDIGAIVDVVLDAGKTATGADKPAPAIVIAEVEITVDHRRENGTCSVGIERLIAGAADETRGERRFVDPGMLVGKFAFKTEATEIVTPVEADVVAKVIVENDRVIHVGSKVV